MVDALAFETELALNALDVGIVILDAQGLVVGWNDWIARASNISRETALGKNLLALFPSLTSTRLPEAIEDSVRVGSSSMLTHSLNKLLPLRGEDESELLHNIIVRPVSSGRSAYCLLQISDVTVAVVRERVLRDRQNARYHAIVDSARDAIITTSADGTIHWVNAAAEPVFGYIPTELLGRPIDMLPSSAEQLDEGFLGSAIDNKSPAIEVAGRRKNGQPAYFAVSFGPWKADDRVFTTTIWRDVTERMQAEAALRESESHHRAPAASRMIQQFASCDLGKSVTSAKKLA
jgi:PAS domain S-box-containing protein